MGLWNLDKQQLSYSDIYKKAYYHFHGNTYAFIHGDRG